MLNNPLAIKLQKDQTGILNYTKSIQICTNLEKSSIKINLSSCRFITVLFISHLRKHKNIGKGEYLTIYTIVFKGHIY